MKGIFVRIYEQYMNIKHERERYIEKLILNARFEFKNLINILSKITHFDLNLGSTSIQWSYPQRY